MNSPTQKSSAPALTRGLKVLEFLASTGVPESLTPIARHLGIAMSSAHSLCSTLANDGYIEKRTDGTYLLTLKILDIASSKINGYNIVSYFHDVCDQIDIIRSNGATITLLEGPDVYFIGVRNNPQPLGVSFKVGMKLPACCTASGRALLSQLSDEEIKEIYPSESLPQVTKANLVKRKDLLGILKTVRERGYSDELAGTRPHMFSYGAVVTNNRGVTQAGVAVVMHEDDITNKIEAEAIDAVKALASQLSKVADLT